MKKYDPQVYTGPGDRVRSFMSANQNSPRTKPEIPKVCLLLAARLGLGTGSGGPTDTLTSIVTKRERTASELLTPYQTLRRVSWRDAL